MVSVTLLLGEMQPLRALQPRPRPVGLLPSIPLVDGARTDSPDVVRESGAARRLQAPAIGSKMHVGGHCLTALSLSPSVFHIDELLTKKQCDHIIALSRGRLQSSFMYIDAYSDDSSAAPNITRVQNSYRTSSTAWLKMGGEEQGWEDPVLATLRDKAAALCGSPPSPSRRWRRICRSSTTAPGSSSSATTTARRERARPNAT